MNILPSSTEGWNTLFQVLSVVLIAGTVLAGAGTILTGRIVSREQARDLASANAEAAKANKGVADATLEITKAKEETARLTTEAETARAERAEADRQIAIAKADAARAKEGIANAEAQAAAARVEVARLQAIVANAEQKRAEAERSLIELQERIKPRHLTAEQQTRAIDRLVNAPKGQLEIRCPVGNPEALSFGRELLELFRVSGWDVVLNDRVIIVPAPVGLKLWIHSEQLASEGIQVTQEAPIRASSILDAFAYARLSIEGQFNHDLPKGSLALIVGFKP